MNIRSGSILALSFTMLVLTSCHRTGVPLDPITIEEQSIAVTSENDQKRLKEIHEKIERLMLSIEYQKMMAERYNLMGDFSRGRMALLRIQSTEHEIAALKKERSQIYTKATA